MKTNKKYITVISNCLLCNNRVIENFYIDADNLVMHNPVIKKVESIANTSHVCECRNGFVRIGKLKIIGLYYKNENSES